MSRCLSRKFTTTLLAGDLEKLMDGLHIPSAHIVAHSGGARISVRFAKLHPERVKSLLLEDIYFRSDDFQASRADEALRIYRDVRSKVPNHFPNVEAATAALKPYFPDTYEGLIKRAKLAGRRGCAPLRRTATSLLQAF